MLVVVDNDNHRLKRKKKKFVFCFCFFVLVINKRKDSNAGSLQQKNWVMPLNNVTELQDSR